jgi:hypothetical protein
MSESPRAGSPAGDSVRAAPEIHAASDPEKSRASTPTAHDGATVREKDLEADAEQHPQQPDLSKLDSKVIKQQQNAKAAGVDGAKASEAELYAHLPEHQATILRQQVETKDFKAGLGAIYRYSTRNDIIIMVVSSVCAIASGAALPLMTILFGSLQGTFGDYFAGQLSYDDFIDEMTGFVLYFVYLAIGEFVTVYISTVGFICEWKRKMDGCNERGCNDNGCTEHALTLAQTPASTSRPRSASATSRAACARTLASLTSSALAPSRRASRPTPT